VWATKSHYGVNDLRGGAADKFELIDLPVSGSESSPSLEIEYFATINHKSRDKFHSYMESLRGHLNLLYGRGLVIRLDNLSLHQDDCRLWDLLIQLALYGKVAMLAGSDFPRLWERRPVELT
jgi:hypothetical protein